MAETTGQESAMAFGLTQSLIAAYPELQKVYDLFVSGNLTDAKLEYYKTDYYRKLSNVSQSRGTDKATRPEVYAQALNDYKITQRKRLVAAGVSDVTDAMLEESYLGGWTDNQLDLAAVKVTKKAISGSAAENADYLKSFANDLGMKYSATDYSSWASSIFTGEASLEDFKTKIKNDAKSAYPAYADQIDKGVTMNAMASAYKSSIASILEVDADSISFDNPYLRKALQYTGPDGKPASKPIWEFEKELRSSPDWPYTKNARDTIDGLGLKVLSDWGLA